MVIFHRSPLANLRTVLQIRVIAPSGLRELVIGVLDSEPGVAHVVVHRDATLDPPGDEITADIAREAANDVVDALKALGVHQRGAITMEVLDTVLSTAAYRAEDEAEGDPADAVVWDELVSRTREESSLTMTYLLFLCIACLIAAVGVSQTPRSPSSEPWWSARNSDRWRRWPSHSCGGACIWRAARRWRC